MKLKKLFGGYDLSIKKVIVFAILAGIYTAIVSMIPLLNDTSLKDISISFEVWILFGIFIIMNSISAKDSAIKCFLFFLISQPLVYLIQVPFSNLGFGIFGYYRVWFIWTLLTIPMGFVGFYIKKDNFWGLLILIPILFFLGYHYINFLKELIFMFPHHLLSAIFCATFILLYPYLLFKDKKVVKVGIIIGILIIIMATIFSFKNPIKYNTDILVSGGDLGVIFDNTYNVYLEKDNIGDVFIVYDEGIQDYLIKGNFKRGGKTTLVLANNDKKYDFKLNILYNKFDVEKMYE